MNDFMKALSERILVLDGAVGTELMRRGGKGCLEAMTLDNEAAVAAVHEDYLDAGADIITTDTLCADALCLEHFGLSERSYEIARRGAEIARACADRYSTLQRRRFVAGSVGPSTRNISLANDVTEERLGEVYETVIRGLLDGGADIILVETVMDSRNAAIAAERCRKLDAGVPVAVSAVLSRLDGRVANGAPIATFLKELPMEDIAVAGFNCSDSPRAMGASLEMLAALCGKPVAAYPAAGEPSVGAEKFVRGMEEYCRKGLVNIVGGCCGTTPEYISLLSRMAAKHAPRVFAPER